jgi:hypothetical protein
VKESNELFFSVENSLPKEVVTDQTGGIGIENVKRRLGMGESVQYNGLLQPNTAGIQNGCSR